MPKRINKKPVLIYNSISDQQKTNPNSLNVAEWNNIINVLKTQANANTKHIETLHRFLIDNYNTNTFGELFLDVDESLIPYLINTVNTLIATLNLLSDDLPDNLPSNYYNKTEIDNMIGDIESLLEGI